jgi:hypothetical protein
MNPRDLYDHARAGGCWRHHSRYHFQNLLAIVRHALQYVTARTTPWLFAEWISYPFMASYTIAVVRCFNIVGHIISLYRLRLIAILMSSFLNYYHPVTYFLPFPPEIIKTHLTRRGSIQKANDVNEHHGRTVSNRLKVIVIF